MPLIASHPGTLPEGRRDEGLVGLHDLMPTLLAAAGAPVPAGIDGLDLSAMLARRPVRCATCWWANATTPRDSSTWCAIAAGSTSTTRTVRSRSSTTWTPTRTELCDLSGSDVRAGRFDAPFDARLSHRLVPAPRRPWHA